MTGRQTNKAIQWRHFWSSPQKTLEETEVSLNVLFHIWPAGVRRVSGREGAEAEQAQGQQSSQRLSALLLQEPNFTTANVCAATASQVMAAFSLLAALCQSNSCGPRHPSSRQGDQRTYSGTVFVLVSY